MNSNIKVTYHAPPDRYRLVAEKTSSSFPKFQITAMNLQGQQKTEERRFAFGDNWNRFIPEITEEKIALAANSLKAMLAVDDLQGCCLLDIGSGSGLFSLAAKRLKAAYVHSFDCDLKSVACTRKLRDFHYPKADDWRIEQGSVLDEKYVRRLGEFDIVYAWGVLHHTGDMWTALANAAIPVADKGKLFIAIYNDQGRASVIWRHIKSIYCSGTVGKILVLGTVLPLVVGTRALKDIIIGVNPLRRYSAEYCRSSRGMSPMRDLIDWLGGYPFEVAKPEEIINFYSNRNFSLDRLATTSGTGCNEFVFIKK